MNILGWIVLILASIWCGIMAWVGTGLAGYYNRECQLLTLACGILAIIVWFTAPFSIVLK
jgi:hypothetical protein